MRACLEGAWLTSDEARALERAAETSSEDLPARLKLLGYYLTRDPASRQRHAHVHWLIERHPDIAIGGFGLIFERVSKEDYEEGKRRWLVAVERHAADPKVLRNAADYLRMSDEALAAELLLRGASIDPDPSWHESLGRLRMAAARRAAPADRSRLAGEAVAHHERALSSKCEPVQRSCMLVELGEAQLEAGRIEDARTTALDILSEADRVRGTLQYGNAIHRGHILLGQVGLAAGDVAGAREHLLAAAATPGSPQLSSFGPDFTLARALLDRGERDTVLSYLEDCKRFWPLGGLLDQWKAAISRGETPSLVPLEHIVRAAVSR